MHICMITDANAFDWNQIRSFLVTVEKGSLSGAARVLNQTQPTIGRQIAALEADLGVVLFERIGRSLRVTPTGLQLVDHVKKMQEAANQIALVASGQSQSVEGEVRITASDLFSVHLLPPILEEIHARAPKLNVEVIAANDIRDLQQREADIAIRHVRPDQPDLIAKLIGEAEARFYASQRYLDRHGTPENTGDLTGHQFIHYGNKDQMIEYMASVGIQLGFENIHLGSEDGNVAWEMVRRGLGIGVMEVNIAGLTPDLLHLFTDAEKIRFPLWLTTHRELHTAKRIRLVFDIISSHLVKIVQAGK